MFESASAPKTAVIAGVTGAVGAALALELSKRSDWRVLGIARNLPAAPIAGVEYLHVDMSDTGQLEAALEDATNITHLFYCARVTHAEQVIEDAGENLALIRNILDAVLAAASNFQHAHVVQGGKYYGVHVGPFKTPAKEEDSRAPIDNFNYDQQDFLVSASKPSRER